MQDAIEEASPAGKSKHKREAHDSDTDFQQTSDEDDVVDLEPPAENVDPTELGEPTKRKTKDGKHNLVVKLKFQDAEVISKILDRPSKTTVSASKMKRSAVKSVKEKSSLKSKHAASRSVKQPVTSIKRSSSNKNGSERAQKTPKVPVFKSTFNPHITSHYRPGPLANDFRVASIDTVTTLYGRAQTKVNPSPSPRTASVAHQTSNDPLLQPSPSVKLQDTPTKQC